MTDPKYMREGLDFAVGKAVEELGELQVALGKTIRWGWDGYNPELPPDERETNAEWVRREIKDVRAALDNLEREMEKCSAGREVKQPHRSGWHYDRDGYCDNPGRGY